MKVGAANKNLVSRVPTTGDVRRKTQKLDIRIVSWTLFHLTKDLGEWPF